MAGPEGQPRLHIAGVQRLSCDVLPGKHVGEKRHQIQDEFGGNLGFTRRAPRGVSSSTRQAECLPGLAGDRLGRRASWRSRRVAIVSSDGCAWRRRIGRQSGGYGPSRILQEGFLHTYDLSVTTFYAPEMSFSSMVGVVKSASDIEGP